MWECELRLVQMESTFLVIVLPYLINQALQHLVRQVVEYYWCLCIGMNILVEVNQRLDMHVQLLQDEVESFGDRQLGGIYNGHCWLVEGLTLGISWWVYEEQSFALEGLLFALDLLLVVILKVSLNEYWQASLSMLKGCLHEVLLKTLRVYLLR